MLPRNVRQEFLCRAYVRAVAAQAGLVCAQPEPDFGIDLCLRSITVENNRRRDAGVQVDLQLKSTTTSSIHEEVIRYDLDADAYRDLRDPVCPCPRILVVLILPEVESHWVEQSTSELILRHAAYWLSLRGAPERAATSSVRVAVPLANLFTPEAATELLRRVTEREHP